jgi:hypothetical protein
MKVTTMRHPANVGAFVAVVVATCVFVTAINAQPPRFYGKFKLSNEVHWANAVLPPGEYSISMNPFEAAAVVRSASGKAQFISTAPITANSEKRCTCLLITVHGGKQTVRSLDLPQLGQTLIYEPLSKTERETLARGDQVKTVPVIIAGK